jgi:hypothetical protein
MATMAKWHYTVRYEIKYLFVSHDLSHFVPMNLIILATNHSALIVDAMRQMENLTQVNGISCIKFRPKTQTDKIFITIQNGSGCSAHVLNSIILAIFFLKPLFLRLDIFKTLH